MPKRRNAPPPSKVQNYHSLAQATVTSLMPQPTERFSSPHITAKLGEQSITRILNKMEKDIESLFIEGDTRRQIAKVSLYEGVEKIYARTFAEITSQAGTADKTYSMIMDMFESRDPMQNIESTDAYFYNVEPIKGELLKIASSIKGIKQKAASLAEAWIIPAASPTNWKAAIDGLESLDTLASVAESINKSCGEFGIRIATPTKEAEANFKSLKENKLFELLSKTTASMATDGMDYHHPDFTTEDKEGLQKEFALHGFTGRAVLFPELVRNCLSEDRNSQASILLSDEAAQEWRQVDAAVLELGQGNETDSSNGKDDDLPLSVKVNLEVSELSLDGWQAMDLETLQVHILRNAGVSLSFESKNDWLDLGVEVTVPACWTKWWPAIGARTLSMWKAFKVMPCEHNMFSELILKAKSAKSSLLDYTKFKTDMTSRLVSDLRSVVSTAKDAGANPDIEQFGIGLAKQKEKETVYSIQRVSLLDDWQVSTSTTIDTYSADGTVNYKFTRPVGVLNVPTATGSYFKDALLLMDKHMLGSITGSEGIENLSAVCNNIMLSADLSTSTTDVKFDPVKELSIHIKRLHKGLRKQVKDIPNVLMASAAFEGLKFEPQIDYYLQVLLSEKDIVRIGSYHNALNFDWTALTTVQSSVTVGRIIGEKAPTIPSISGAIANAICDIAKELVYSSASPVRSVIKAENVKVSFTDTNAKYIKRLDKVSTKFDKVQLDIPAISTLIFSPSFMHSTLFTMTRGEIIKLRSTEILVRTDVNSVMDSQVEVVVARLKEVIASDVFGLIKRMFASELTIEDRMNMQKNTAFKAAMKLLLDVVGETVNGANKVEHYTSLVFVSKLIEGLKS